MLEDGIPFEHHLAILATILMTKHGGEVVVTHDEIQAARELLATHEVQMVAYEESRIFDRDQVTIKFRHRSREVLVGRVV